MSNFRKLDIDLLFNDPVCFDTVVQVNDTSFNIISALVTKQSSFFAEACNSSENPCTTHILGSAVILTRRIIKIHDPELKNDAVEKVLKFLYGKKIENVTIDIIYAAIKFRISDLICPHFKNMTTEFFLKHYMIVLNENNDLIPFFEKYFKTNIKSFNDIFDITSRMSLEYIITLLSSDDLMCSETLIYDIANHYCNKNNKPEVLKCVRLTLLPHEVLINQVGNNPNIDLCQYKNALEQVILSKKETLRNSFTKDKFCIGKHGQKYDGYKILTKDDIDNTLIKEEIAKSYVYNGGFRSMDNINVDHLCSENHILKINTYFLLACYKIVKKNEILKFNCNYFGQEIIVSTISDITVSSYDISHNSYSKHDHTKNVGLFMLCDS